MRVLACPPMAPCWQPPVMCRPPEGEEPRKAEGQQAGLLSPLKNTGRLDCHDEDDDDEGSEDEEEGLNPSLGGGGIPLGGMGPPARVGRRAPATCSKKLLAAGPVVGRPAGHVGSPAGGGGGGGCTHRLSCCHPPTGTTWCTLASSPIVGGSLAGGAYLAPAAPRSIPALLLTAG